MQFLTPMVQALSAKIAKSIYDVIFPEFSCSTSSDRFIRVIFSTCSTLILLFLMIFRKMGRYLLTLSFRSRIVLALISYQFGEFPMINDDKNPINYKIK